jgi:glucose-6-phosphate dehydrogenase assembly protein OpcA
VSRTTVMTPADGWTGGRTSIDAVARQLARQRRPAGGGPPFTLAGVLNLVAHAPRAEDIEGMRDLIERLADHQPSRAVLICAGAEAAGIDATVSTSCRLSDGHTGIAVELIVLTLHGETHAGAVSAATPLLRAELPTVLWWPGPPDDSETLARLAGLADRIVTEAARAADGAAGVRALADWAVASDTPFSDLAWAGVTQWRQLIAQVVDADALAALRSAPASATLRHAGPAPDVGTLLVAGWLADAVGPGLSVELRPTPGDGSGIRAVGLVGGVTGRRLSIQRLAERDAASVSVVEADGSRRTRALPLPCAGRGQLLAGELEVQRHDDVFLRSLSAATALAAA